MKLSYFRDKAGRYRWRLRARNNEIIASSSEGFSNRVDMLVNIQLTAEGLRATREKWQGDLQI